MTGLIVPFVLVVVVICVAIYQRWVSNEINDRILGAYLLGAICVAVGAYYMHTQRREGIILYLGILLIFAGFAHRMRRIFH